MGSMLGWLKANRAIPDAGLGRFPAMVTGSHCAQSATGRRFPAMVNAIDTASVSGVVSNGLRADAAVSCRPVSCCATPGGNGVMVTATVTASSCAGVAKKLGAAGAVEENGDDGDAENDEHGDPCYRCC